MIIYGLIDPRDGQLRHVGQTGTLLKRRLASHCCPSARKARTPLGTWLRELHGAGLRPEIESIELLRDGDEGEKFWIAYFRSIGCDLTNVTAGGKGLAGVRPSERTRQRLREKSLAQPFREWLHSPTARAKAAASLRGKRRPLSAIAATAAKKRGQKHRPDSLKQMSRAQLRTWHKPGRRVEMARAHGGRPFVDQHGNRYEVIQETARRLGLQASKICNVLKGKRAHTGGYVFRYA